MVPESTVGSLVGGVGEGVITGRERSERNDDDGTVEGGMLDGVGEGDGREIRVGEKSGRSADTVEGIGIDVRGVRSGMLVMEVWEGSWNRDWLCGGGGGGGGRRVVEVVVVGGGDLLGRVGEGTGTSNEEGRQ